MTGQSLEMFAIGMRSFAIKHLQMHCYYLETISNLLKINKLRSILGVRKPHLWKIRPQVYYFQFIRMLGEFFLVVQNVCSRLSCHLYPLFTSKQTVIEVNRNQRLVLCIIAFSCSILTSLGPLLLNFLLCSFKYGTLAPALYT